MKTFQPACQRRARPRRTEPWPGVCTVCRISSCERQRAPDTQARRGWVPGELPGSGYPLGGESSLGPGLGDRWVSAVCICPSPGRPVPLHPAAVLQRELVCKINAPAWFHPQTGETPISQGQRGIMVSRIPPTFSVTTQSTFTASWETWASSALLGQRESSPKSRSAVCPAARCALPSA